MQTPLKLQHLAYAGGVIILLFAAYLPIFTGPAEFIGDDHYYIVNNKSRVHAFTAESLAEIWSKPMQHDYFPVTITSFAIDHALYGLNPKMFRLTNLVIFFFIGLVTFSVTKQLNNDHQTGRGMSLHTAAFMSVVLMLLHPVNVESVALISNRKELLYVLFGLISFRLYIVSPKTATSLMGALFFMVFAQLSKGTAVMLPVVFLAYALLCENVGHSYKRRVQTLLPFFVAAGIVFSYQFSIALQSVVATTADIPLGKKIGGIVRIAHTATKHFLFPAQLTYDYDIRWPHALNFGTEWILPSLIAAIMAFFLFKKRYGYLFSLMFVCIPFVPYLNIVPLTAITKDHMVYYDHYMLFSCMAASVLVTRLLHTIPARWKSFGVAPVLIITVAFLFQDYYLAGFYKTRETLYKRCISTSPSLSRGYYYLAEVYIEQGRYDKAIEYLMMALSANRDNPDVNLFQLMGNAYAFSGRYSEAEKAYRTYLSYKPDDIQVLQNLSSALIMLKKNDEAREIIERWLALSPDDHDALFNLSLLNNKNTRGQTDKKRIRTGD